MKTIKNIKITVLILLVGLFAASCIENKVVPLGDEGDVIIRLTPTSTTGFFLKVAEGISTPQTFSLIDVRRDAPTAAALNATTVVTLKLDPAVLAAYNAANNKSYITIPSSQYTTNPASTGGDITLTFGPGEFAKQVYLTIPNALLLDPSNAYALAYKMEVTSGEGILSGSSNSELVVEVLPKNAWDGRYLMKGYIMRPGDTGGLEGFFSNQAYSLITDGARKVRWNRVQVWANGTNVGGIGIWSIEVLPNGTDILVTDPGVAANFEMVPGYPHRYDPALKTFFFQVQWGTAVPRNRGCTDTLVYVGPR